MDIEVFKNKLDNRELWGVNSEEAFESAYKWAEKSNSESKNSCVWSWDCGLKLDYDGDICSILSRFYPPHKASEEYRKYHGYVHVYVSDEEVFSIEIESSTLDELKSCVENYVSELETKIQNKIKSIFQ